MANPYLINNKADIGFVEIKSKFDAEFRRFSLDGAKYSTFEAFRELLGQVHLLRPPGSDNQSSSDEDFTFHIFYIDPKDNDLLPITNTDNYRRALHSARPLLRLVIQRQGECEDNYYKRTVTGGSSLLTSMLGGTPKPHKTTIPISKPTEFRQVSAIIDVDVVPETCRRVRLLKHGSEKPLGFYIRDGTSVRVTPNGLEKVPGIFISRLLAGGLAESTGLLAVNDEVLEVNGIEVAGKTLDQVTDMMVANSHNLIITVKPANQRTTLSAIGPRRGSYSRNSNVSHGSHLSRSSTHSNSGRGGGGIDYSGVNANYSDSGEPDEEDEIRDLTSLSRTDLVVNHRDSAAYSSTGSNSANNNSSSRKPVLHL